ncbi:hypothetical protein LCT58_23440 [Escherichia coli]|uniref:hypothetical protein n=1 Tax=Escherichia coli TaxID=562 RepID=UPI001EFE81F8|nr:hypothetical protein [Escherichia coli]MCG9430048.1 hypothetical protein [Escherichia coli]
MKRMKIIIGLTILFSSFTAFSGGSWKPSVDPISCIMSTSSDNGAWSWNDGNVSCNEVIERGYASGVAYSGKFVYADGNSQNFHVVIKPGEKKQVSPYGQPQGISDYYALWHHD